MVNVSSGFRSAAFCLTAQSKKIQTKPMPYCNEYALLKLGKDRFFQRLKTGISGVWGGIRGVFVVVVVDI